MSPKGFKMTSITDDIVNNFTFDTKDFHKKYVPIELGLPYVKILMKYFTEMYPFLKVSPFLRLISNPNLIVRTCMLDINDVPKVFFVSERVEAKGDELERIECYFLKEYFNMITEYIMQKEQTPKEKLLLN